MSTKVAAKKSVRKPKFIIPKSPAKAGDLLYQLREQRSALNRQAEEIETNEKAIKAFLIATLPKGEASGIAGMIARISIETKEIPIITDKKKFQAYIKKTGAFELMQGRISEAAITEQWQAKKTIPGIGKFNAITVSCKKK